MQTRHLPDIEIAGQIGTCRQSWMKIAHVQKKTTYPINLIHNEFNDLFSGIDCFEGIFSLQVK